MCLVFHSEGHLSAQLVYEQIWPKLHSLPAPSERSANPGAKPLRQPPRVGAVECYDLVLRNHSLVPLKRLYILSPHKVAHPLPTTPEASAPQLIKPGRHEYNRCDWIFEDRRVRQDGNGICELVIAGQTAKKIKAKRLEPIVTAFPWAEFEADEAMQFLFFSTEMTIAAIEFEGNAVLMPYDSMNPDATTYWVRLVFEPFVSHRINQAIAFGGLANPLFYVQPCTVHSTTGVLNRLRAKLDQLAKSGELFRENATKVKSALFRHVFNRPATSTRTKDHRISLVVDQRFLLLNHQIDGPCGFEGVDSVPGDDELVQYTWFTGAEYYFDMVDALRSAANIFKYLKAWASTEKDAKRKEDVSAVVRDTHDNVSHVVQSLFELDYLIEAKETPGAYVFNKRSDPKLLNDDTMTGIEMGPPEVDAKIRDVLYGQVRIPNKSDASGNPEYSRYRPRPFRIHWDIGFRS